MKRAKNFIFFTLVTVLGFSMVACGTKQEESQNVAEEMAESGDVNTSDESEGQEEKSDDATSVASSETVLPAYEYPGPEYFYTVLYKYLCDEFGQHYSDYDVMIPCPIIVEVDESDKDEVKVYGDFWVFGYVLNGDTLENTCGGSYPGCIHIKSTNADYEVIGMDIVEDGSNYDPSAKKIFGERYDAFIKATGDSDAREEIRAQIIANYVYANNLSITAYKDYGWDPVTLPEENIDSFYSKLN